MWSLARRLDGIGAPPGRRPPPGPWPEAVAALRQIGRSLPARQESVVAARQAALGLAPPRLAPRAEHDLALVTTELADNAVRHGDGEWFALVLLAAGRRMWIVVASAGGPFSAPKEMPPPEAPSGRGLALVAALSARAGVERRNGRNLAWSEMYLPPARRRAGGRQGPPAPLPA